MIVGIVPTGSGPVVTDTFVSADSVSDGVAKYCGWMMPPGDPADYIGFDTGWPGPGAQQPEPGKQWSYDRDSGALSQENAPPAMDDPGGDWQHSVLDDTLTEPPADPDDGDRYIVPSGATGAWEEWSQYIVEWDSAWGSWRTLVPMNGCFAYILASGMLKKYDGQAWVPASLVEYVLDETEYAGTPTTPYEYKRFTTAPIAPGEYQLDLCVRARMSKKNKYGTVVVEVDGQEVMRESVDSVVAKSYTCFTRVNFTGDKASRQISFFFLSPQKKTSVIVDMTKYRIQKT